MSVSDFGEKDAFPGKLRGVFAAFGGVYDERALGGLLDATARLRPLHQTTFGLEWDREAAAPRLKVYLEELRAHYPKPARIALARQVCRAAGIEAPPVPADEDLAALCLDFFPGRRLAFKTYAYRPADAPEDLFRTLSRESRCFYYKTLRFGEGGLESEKLYKVYEVRQIADPSAAFEEVDEAFASVADRASADLVTALRRLAAERGAAMYPVLCAIDRRLGGGVRVDAYLSVKPQSGRPL